MSPLSDDRGNPDNVSGCVEPWKIPTQPARVNYIVLFLHLSSKNWIGAYLLWEIANNIS